MIWYTTMTQFIEFVANGLLATFVCSLGIIIVGIVAWGLDNQPLKGHRWQDL